MKVRGQNERFCCELTRIRTTAFRAKLRATRAWSEGGFVAADSKFTLVTLNIRNHNKVKVTTVNGTGR